jgi:hypothetical protein
LQVFELRDKPLQLGAGRGKVHSGTDVERRYANRTAPNRNLLYHAAAQTGGRHTAQELDNALDVEEGDQEAGNGQQRQDQQGKQNALL